MLAITRPCRRIPHSSRNPVLRAFSSSPRRSIVDLHYDLHEPPKNNTPGAPVLFLHGLFGSKKNNRSMSKALARSLSRPVYALDLRNHGDSPHDPQHDYTALAEDVESFIAEHELEQPTLIGHSMGAKTVMAVALRKPQVVGSLIAVDNAPVDAALKSDFGGYVKGMRRIEEARVGRQSEADEILKEYAKELPVRQFLLTNLIRAPDGNYLKWRIPIKYLGRALDEMADFPFKDPDQARYNGPALFVRGIRSHYVADEMLPIIGRFFPKFELADIDCGHWVTSEKPEEFKNAVVEFLQGKE